MNHHYNFFSHSRRRRQRRQAELTNTNTTPSSPIPSIHNCKKKSWMVGKRGTHCIRRKDVFIHTKRRGKEDINLLFYTVTPTGDGGWPINADLNILAPVDYQLFGGLRARVVIVMYTVSAQSCNICIVLYVSGKGSQVDWTR